MDSWSRLFVKLGFAGFGGPRRLHLSSAMRLGFDPVAILDFVRGLEETDSGVEFFFISASGRMCD